MKIRIILIAAMILCCSLLFSGASSVEVILDTNGKLVCKVDGKLVTEEELLNADISGLEANGYVWNPPSGCYVLCTIPGSNCLICVKGFLRAYYVWSLGQ